MTQEQLDEKFIKNTAKDLFMALSKRKQRIFAYWYKKNNWDVKSIYSKCLETAIYINKENRKRF